MEPITAAAIVAALSAGATKAASSFVSEIGKDAYAALKMRLRSLIGSDAIAKVEADPASKDAQEEVVSRLGRQDTHTGDELTELARALIQALEADTTGADAIVIERISAANVLLRKIESAGQFVARDLNVRGDFTIDSLKTGKK